MDQRIEAVLAEVPRSNDAAALRVYLTVIAKVRPEKREALWSRWERNLVSHLREHVARLHVVFDQVAAEEQAKADDFEGYLANIRKGERTRRFKKTVEGILKDGAEGSAEDRGAAF